MNCGTERFAALARGQLPDQVPIICNLPEHGARMLGLSIRDYYSRPENIVEGQLCLRKRFGYDTLLGFYYLAKEAEILGCRSVIHAPDGPPNVGHLVIDSLESIERFIVPDDLADNPHCRDVMRCITMLKAEAGGKYPVISAMTASFSLPPMLMGMDRWLNLLLNGPESLCRELLEKCSLFCRRYLDLLRSAGADMIAYVNPVASATFLNERQFTNCALPWVLTDFADGDVHDIIYFSGGGEIGPQIPLIAAARPFPAYYLSPQDDIIAAKVAVAGTALVIGTINDMMLLQWNAEAIVREVAKIIAAGKQGGGFAFGTLLTPYLVNEDTIDILLQAAYSHGAYPAGETEG